MKTLRPYQAEACDAIMRDWDAHRSTLLVLATGCGKTFTASEVIRRRKGAGRVLWIAHREELITQGKEAIEAHTGLTCGIEKAEQRASVHGFFGVDEVVVASVQTLQGRRLERFGRDHFGTLIVDEAHHATARSYRAILEHFEGAKVLGLTATPDRGDAVGLGNVFESVAYRYEIRRAIREGYLCPIAQKLVECADLDLSDVRTVAGDLNQGELERAMTIDAVLHQVAGPLVREAGDRPTIVFTVSVAQAHALVDVLAGYTQARVRAIDGTTVPELRRRYLAEFAAGETQFMINCGVLTEGFDAPRTACIAVARPTKSRALYTQMIGRGTRLFEGKQDCLVLDFVGNSGRHKLVTPLDVLAGKPLPEDVQRAAEEMVADGMPSEEALAKAEQDAIDRAARAEERRRREAKIQAEVAYRAQLVDPFAMFDVERGETGPRATEAQLDALRRAKIPLDYVPSRREASAMIDRLKERRSKGLATYAQARQLIKRGLPGDKMTFEEARRALDAIANNGWRVPQVVADYCHGKYGQEAAE